MLDPFVDYQLFVDRIPGGVASSDEPRARAVLQDACVLVRQVAETDFVSTPPPDAVVMVTMAAARRAFVNPDAITRTTIDDYTREFASSSTDPSVFLTSKESAAIRAAMGLSNLWALHISRGDADIPSPSGVVPILDPPAQAEYDPFGEGWPA